MAIALKSCAMCRGQLELSSIEKVSAENDPLKVTILGMPAAKCAKGHAAPVNRDFLLWLLRELRERLASALPAAQARGMLFRKYLCACGRELPGKPQQRQAFQIDMAFEGAPAFKAELEMPVYQCGGCGKAQLRSHDELRKAAANAMVDICDRAGFPHSG
jgi:hypothetical protein